MDHHTGHPLSWRHGLKWLVTVDVDRQLLLAQAARQGPWNDCANLPKLVQAANQVVPIGVVLADAEFNQNVHIAIGPVFPARHAAKNAGVLHARSFQYRCNCFFHFL